MRFSNSIQEYLSKQIEMKLPKDGLMHKTRVENRNLNSGSNLLFAWGIYVKEKVCDFSKL